MRSAAEQLDKVGVPFADTPKTDVAIRKLELRVLLHNISSQKVAALSVYVCSVLVVTHSVMWFQTGQCSPKCAAVDIA